MEIFILNCSTLVSDEAGQKATAAIQRQVVEHFMPAWGVGAVLHFVPKGAQPPPASWVVRLEDECPDAGALGFHEDSVLPSGIVGVKTCQDDGVPWESCLSHEVLELVLDPWATICAEGNGTFYAYEAADPVQGGGVNYQIDGVPLEPFILPNYFRPGSPPPYDNLGILSAPLTLAPGGYQLVNNGSGWTQKNGEHVRAGKRQISGRRARRAKCGA